MKNRSIYEQGSVLFSEQVAEKQSLVLAFLVPGLVALISHACALPVLVDGESENSRTPDPIGDRRSPMVIEDQTEPEARIVPKDPLATPRPDQVDGDYNHQPAPADPVITLVSCEPTGQKYSSIPISPPHLTPKTDPNVDVRLRGMITTNGLLELIDYPGETDPQAMPPRLSTLFRPPREPGILEVFKIGVYEGIDHGFEGGPEGLPPEWGTVHLIAFATTKGETISVPLSGYTLAPNTGAIVLYADQDFITMHYMPDDSIVLGYTLHIFDLCVDKNLLSFYRELDRTGRNNLPALSPNQPIGRANGSRIVVSIRDTGMFMDPRGIRGWWRWPNG